MTIILLGIGGLVLFLVIFYLLKKVANRQSPETQAERIRDNDIFTISKVQVALSAHAKEVQSSLSELTLNVDTNTQKD